MLDAVHHPLRHGFTYIAGPTYCNHRVLPTGTVPSGNWSCSISRTGLCASLRVNLPLVQRSRFLEAQVSQRAVGSLAMGTPPPTFFYDGNGTRCQFPADHTLIPENAAADSWLSSSINFCLGNTTCQSMTNLPPPAWKIVAYIDRQEELSRIRSVQHLTGS